MDESEGWFRDNLYLLKLFFRYAGSKVIMEIMIKGFRAVINVFSFVWLLNYLLARIQEGAAYHDMFPILAFFLILHAIAIGMECWYNSYYAPQANVRIRSSLDEMLSAKAARLSVWYYEDPKFYDMICQARDCSRSTVFLAFSNLTDAISRFTALVSTMLIVINIDKWLLVFVVFVFPMVFFSEHLGRAAGEKEKALTTPRRMKAYVGNVMQDKGRIMEMRTSNAGSIPDKYYHKGQEDSLSIHRTFGMKLFVTDFLMRECSVTLIMVVCYLYGILRSLSMHEYMISEFSIMFVAIMNMISNLRKLFRCYEKSIGYSVKIAVLRQYMAFDEEKDGTYEAGPFETLEFRNVSFAYGSEEVLHKVNFRIKKGEKIAMAGLNGAGKSTAAKLILRFYDVTEGKILYNGRDIRDYALAGYRRRFAALFQDFCLFQLSIAENVSMGGDCGMEEVGQALANAGVRSLPWGLERGIGREYDKDGLILSGGQKQKIAMARMYCREYDFAILDEPSASLDLVSSKELFDEFLKMTEGKSAIIVGHQLSFLQDMDRILFFSQGRIAEAGTHQELMALGGEYSRLYRYQTGNGQDLIHTADGKGGGDK